MAYKQEAGRGKSDSYASMISNGLINGDGDPPLKKTTTTTSKKVKGGTEFEEITSYKGDPAPQAKPASKKTKDPNAYMEGLSKRFPGSTGKDLADKGYIHPGRAEEYQLTYAQKPDIKKWFEEDPKENTKKITAKITPKPATSIPTNTPRRTVSTVPYETPVGNKTDDESKKIEISKTRNRGPKRLLKVSSSPKKSIYTSRSRFGFRKKVRTGKKFSGIGKKRN